MNLTRIDLTRMFAVALLMATGSSITARAQTASKPAPPGQPQTFHVCQMTYARCVWSPCEGTVVMGNQATTTCQCPVMSNSFSVGANDCKTDAPTATTVKSRYSPINTYARCTMKRPWAMCLDSPCTINSDKTTASCTCTLMQDAGDFMYQPDKPDQCSSGIVSSATVDDLDTITDYLQTQDQMPVSNFTVVNQQKK